MYILLTIEGDPPSSASRNPPVEGGESPWRAPPPNELGRPGAPKARRESLILSRHPRVNGVIDRVTVACPGGAGGPRDWGPAGCAPVPIRPIGRGTGRIPATGCNLEDSPRTGRLECCAIYYIAALPAAVVGGHPFSRRLQTLRRAGWRTLRLPTTIDCDWVPERRSIPVGWLRPSYRVPRSCPGVMPYEQSLI